MIRQPGAKMPALVRVMCVSVISICACATRPQPLPATPEQAVDPGEVAPAGETVADANRPQPGETCASFLQRLTPSVACEPIDDGSCTCKVTDEMATVVAGTPPGADTPPPAQEPPSSGPAATLVFGTAPANTLVRCLSDICPEKQPVMVSAGYPKIPLAAGEQKVQLEFQAPGHKTEVMEYTLRAGANTISFTLQPDKPVGASVATLRYSGAPKGTTVECMSGPCPDQQVHPVTEPFPEFKMSGDNETVLLRFRAPGYRTGVGRYELRRGANLIPIELDPVPIAN